MGEGSTPTLGNAFMDLLKKAALQAGRAGLSPPSEAVPGRAALRGPPSCRPGQALPARSLPTGGDAPSAAAALLPGHRGSWRGTECLPPAHSPCRAA